MVTPSATPHAPADGRARIPDLAGALNFRDLGGYPTIDGRTVRWNRLYRSGTTHGMTPGDLEFIVARGIRFAYDLRSNTERSHHPNRLDGVSEIDYAYRNHDRMPGDLKRLMRQPDARPEDSRALMLSLYRDLPYEFRESYSEIFTRLARGDLPLVFNCTAGKDRTGVAAALVLTALHVPRHIIMEDYQLTDQFYDQCCALMLHDDKAKFLDGIDRRLWEPMMRADAAYLESMFDELQAAHGSIEAYLSQELGADGAMLERIRSQLLE